MFMKKPRIKPYSYTPRFYDPAKDPEERKKRKLSINRGRKFVVRKSNIFRNILILIVIVLLYLRMIKVI
jgi:hypothetical protein